MRLADGFVHVMRIYAQGFYERIRKVLGHAKRRKILKLAPGSSPFPQRPSQPICVREQDAETGVVVEKPDMTVFLHSLGLNNCAASTTLSGLDVLVGK